MGYDSIRTVKFILESNANLAGFHEVSGEIKEAHGRMTKLAKELEKLKDENKEDTEEYRRKNEALQNEAANLKEIVRHQKELLGTMDLQKMSRYQLLTIQRKLRDQLNRTAGDTQTFRDTAKALKEVNEQLAHIKELSGEAGRSFLDMGKFTSGIGKLFGAFGLGIGVLNAVGTAARKAWENIKQMSELYSDIRKTTDLSVFDTARLTSNLARMNTRTDITQRAEYAVIAGRMGMRGVTEITNFVREADKIVVSLGDSIKGSADEIITKIAKIVNAFGADTKNAITFSEAMERIGSTLNRVAAEGVASEEWQVDFLYRTGAIARALDISAQDMIGFGTVLEEAGNSVEVSGTAVSQFFGIAAKNAEDFAARAGVSVEEFIYLLETDANQALKLVLKSIKEGAISNTELIKSFSELGIDGERSTKVILSLANNLDKLTDKQRLANEEFERNTSLTQEYQKKQQTIGASIEKIWNGIARAVTNSKLVLFLQDVFAWMSKIADVSQAEVMEEQITQLHILEGRLRDTNTQWEEKREILDQLRSEYPGLFADIENEIDLQSRLAEEMQRANEALLERIVIQKSQEKIEGLYQEKGELIRQKAAVEEEVTKYFVTMQPFVNKKILDQIGTSPNGFSSEALREYNDALKKGLSKSSLQIGEVSFAAAGAQSMVLIMEKIEEKIARVDEELKKTYEIQNKEKEALSDILNKDKTAPTPSLTKQDYLATLGAVAAGGTTYRNFDAATKAFIEGQAIDPATLDLMKQVLDKEKEVIARLGGSLTPEALRGEYQGNVEYTDYGAFLGTKGTNVPAADEKGAEKARQDAERRAAAMEKALAKATKTGEQNLEKSYLESLSEYERRRREIENTFRQATEEFKTEYLAAAGDTLTGEERDKMSQLVVFLEDVKQQLLDTFDNDFHQKMVDKIFDLTATDEDKAFAALEKKFREPLDHWASVRDTATDPQARQAAEDAIKTLTAAYDREFAALVEKYKPDEQKEREKKERQLYDAARYYAMPEAYTGTDKEIAQARLTSDLLVALRADTYESMRQLGEEFLASEYTSFLKFLQDKRAAQVKADKEEMEGRIATATQTASSVQQVSSAATQAELQASQIAMNKELEAAEGNERKQEQIRRKYAKREAELKVKQAMVDYFAGLVSLIAKSWGAFGIGTGISMAAYTAVAGIQIASLREAAEAFAYGKYDTIRADDGRTYTARIQSDANRTQFVHEPTYFTGQNAIVGERMPEIIISGPDTARLRHMRPDVIQAIAELPGARGFVAGKYPQDMSVPQSSATSPFGKDGERRLIRVLEELGQKMDTPFTGVIVADEKNMVNVQRALDNLSARQKRSRTF